MATPSPAPDWREVVTSLEAQRVTAYRRVDPTRLTQVYVADSAARDTDTAILRTWARRGWRPQGLTVAVRAVRVVSEAGEQVRLRVTMSVSSFRLRDPAGRVAATVRRADRGLVGLTLRRVAGSWRIAAVRRISRPAR